MKNANLNTKSFVITGTVEEGEAATELIANGEVGAVGMRAPDRAMVDIKQDKEVSMSTPVVEVQRAMGLPPKPEPATYSAALLTVYGARGKIWVAQNYVGMDYTYTFGTSLKRTSVEVTAKGIQFFPHRVSSNPAHAVANTNQTQPL